MPRVTNLQKAEAYVVELKAKLEVYQSTPDYAAAMEYRCAVKAADETMRLAQVAFDNVNDKVSLRLGILVHSATGRLGWNPAFLKELTRVFETVSDEDLPGFRHNPFYSLTRKVADTLLSREPEVQQGREAVDAASAEVRRLTSIYPRPDADLGRQEREIGYAVSAVDYERARAESRKDYYAQHKEDAKDAEAVAETNRKKRAATKIMAYLDADVTGLPEGFQWEMAR